MRQQKIREALDKCPLYGMTAPPYFSGGNVAAVQMMIQCGFSIVQYRDKDAPIRQKLEELKEIRRITQEAGVLLIVNDHLDLAMSIKADGVHLGQDDFPLAEARQVVGEEMILGLSTHTPAQAQAAEKVNADYIGVGPVHHTVTKPHEPKAGIDYLEYVHQHIQLPFVALGGVTEENLPPLRAAGAKNVCIVKDFWEAENLPSKFNRLLHILIS